jgi:hypothetical protein
MVARKSPAAEADEAISGGRVLTKEILPGGGVRQIARLLRVGEFCETKESHGF